MLVSRPREPPLPPSSAAGRRALRGRAARAGRRAREGGLALQAGPEEQSLHARAEDHVLHAEGQEAPCRASRRRTRPPKVDCFYVYPTVSDQQTPLATKHIDPGAALDRALPGGALLPALPRVRPHVPAGHARRAARRRRWAPRPTRSVPYNDVREAWRTYLRKYNKGRGVVIMGHSQGTFVLRRLVAEEIDKKPKVRRKLVSAILLGGNVTVKKGKDVGGDFKHVRACRAKRQTRLRDRVLHLQRAGARGRGLRPHGHRRGSRCSAPTRPRSAAARLRSRRSTRARPSPRAPRSPRRSRSPA